MKTAGNTGSVPMFPSLLLFDPRSLVQMNEVRPEVTSALARLITCLLPSLPVIMRGKCGSMDVNWISATARPHNCRSK